MKTILVPNPKLCERNWTKYRPCYVRNQIYLYSMALTLKNLHNAENLINIHPHYLYNLSSIASKKSSLPPHNLLVVANWRAFFGGVSDGLWYLPCWVLILFSIDHIFHAKLNLNGFWVIQSMLLLCFPVHSWVHALTTWNASSTTSFCKIWLEILFLVGYS